jgi:hypothetical protein
MDVAVTEAIHVLSSVSMTRSNSPSSLPTATDVQNDKLASVIIVAYGCAAF